MSSRHPSDPRGSSASVYASQKPTSAGSSSRYGSGSLTVPSSGRGGGGGGSSSSGVAESYIHARPGASKGETNDPRKGFLSRRVMIVLVRSRGKERRVIWALFVPNLKDQQSCTFGRLIYLDGNLQMGFRPVIKRNWDMNTTQSEALEPVDLGIARQSVLADKRGTILDGYKFECSGSAMDDFEASMLEVRPESTKGATEMSHCQHWIYDCVDKLVEEGFLYPPVDGKNRGKDPVSQILRSLPKKY